MKPTRPKNKHLLESEFGEKMFRRGIVAAVCSMPITYFIVTAFNALFD